MSGRRCNVVTPMGTTATASGRAVDQDGFVLDVLGKLAETPRLQGGLKGPGRAPRVMITGKLGSYAVAGSGVMLASSIAGTKGSITEKLPPADPTTRKDQEALQVSAPASAFRHHPRSDCQSLPLSPPRPLIIRPS